MTKKERMSRDLNEVVGSMRIKVTSAKFGTRDGIKMALVNEELKKSDRYTITQYARWYKPEKTGYEMYLNGRYIGSSSYLMTDVDSKIYDFLNRYPEISYFRVYNVLI